MNLLNVITHLPCENFRQAIGDWGQRVFDSVSYDRTSKWLNQVVVEDMAWMCNYIPQKDINVITHPCPNLILACETVHPTKQRSRSRLIMNWQVISKRTLTHWDLVGHLCVSKLCHHWLRWWRGACLPPSHHPSQCRLVACWIHLNLNQNKTFFSEKNIFWKCLPFCQKLRCSFDLG